MKTEYFGGWDYDSIMAWLQEQSDSGMGQLEGTHAHGMLHQRHPGTAHYGMRTPPTPGGFLYWSV